MPKYFLSAAILLALVGTFWRPVASAQLPPGVCVIEIVTTANGSVYSCENRVKFPAAQAAQPVGQPCPTSVTVPTFFAKAADGTCLTVTFMVQPGFVARLHTAPAPVARNGDARICQWDGRGPDDFVESCFIEASKQALLTNPDVAAWYAAQGPPHQIMCKPQSGGCIPAE